MRVILVAGGGGVGKTSSSAALALALARAGQRAVVVTVDPARRLADALGVPLSTEPQPVSFGGAEAGRLSALMPEPGAVLPRLLERLLPAEDRARMEQNAVYRIFREAPAGMHEIASVLWLAERLADDPPDALVLDTAPSRHALDFLAYPTQLARVLSGRTVKWFARFGGARRSWMDAVGLGWARQRVEDAVGRVLPAEVIAEGAAFFATLAGAREAFAERARRAHEWFGGGDARGVLVAAPTGSSVADAIHLAGAFREAGVRPQAAWLNRASLELPTWLRAEDGGSPHAALAQLRAE
ncbi:MAG TPA: ArsA-related P-loop ATPase, partial [Polyangiaceae bacterium LLY-WYZ-15_(1-7)]|nr:ArsA-related P-loop ATPase [Polyangiaceae bacterium LLY-WYZ-15_(1-7)]